jgi:hypothetical protein
MDLKLKKSPEGIPPSLLRICCRFAAHQLADEAELLYSETLVSLKCPQKIVEFITYAQPRYRYFGHAIALIFESIHFYECFIIWLDSIMLLNLSTFRIFPPLSLKLIFRSSLRFKVFYFFC